MKVSLVVLSHSVNPTSLLFLFHFCRMTNDKKSLDNSVDGAAKLSQTPRQNSNPASPNGGGAVRSSIPLPKNPTLAKVGTLHPSSSSQSENDLESKTSSNSESPVMFAFTPGLI